MFPIKPGANKSWNQYMVVKPSIPVAGGVHALGRPQRWRLWCSSTAWCPPCTRKFCRNPVGSGSVNVEVSGRVLRMVALLRAMCGCPRPSVSGQVDCYSCPSRPGFQSWFKVSRSSSPLWPAYYISLWLKPTVPKDC